MEFLNYFSNVFSLANILILILGTVGGLLMGVADCRTKNIESFDSLEQILLHKLDLNEKKQV